MSRPVRDVTGLRIAHVIETDGPGGAERVLAHLSTALQAAGAYNVAFLPADGAGWLARQLEGPGATIAYFREEGRVWPAWGRALRAGARPATGPRGPRPSVTFGASGARAAGPAGRCAPP